ASCRGEANVIMAVTHDTDECSEKSKNKCDMNANCTNTPGSYNCLCHTGFLGNGKSCRGDDNKQQRCPGDTTMNYRLKTQNCFNIPGSYNCSCSTGYRGWKLICTGNQH
ncbi:fibrillin-1-like, partial, partial [Paramuricea clavata]